MPAQILTKAAWWALLVVTVFNALSAVGGGVAMILTDGLGMPRSFLDHSPFASFTIPALMLLTVLGGSQTLAAVLLMVRRESALLWSAVAGLAMVIWIRAETAMIEAFGLLQALYFITGIVEVVLVLALLGIVSWLPRVSFDAPAAVIR